MEEIEYAVRKCENLIRRGYSFSYILRVMRNYTGDPEEIYEIARCRIKMRDKFSVHNLYFDEYGLRYSTPEVVGRYRAERIKGYRIADISCGVGMQAIFFSFTNERVLGVDIDERRIRYARLNARAYGRENVEFVVGNCFSSDIVERTRGYDIIFSDPARKESEMERKLETLLPSPLKVIERYGDRNYIFDLPPQISRARIPESWEKEYISLDGRIKRLTAYTSDLRECDRRAVSLPSGESICSSDNEDSFIKTSELSNYIYLVDESIYYASLLGAFQKKYGVEYLQVGKRRTLATSGKIIRTAFLKPFQVVCVERSIKDMIACLRALDIGKLTLLFSVDPAKYWEIRKQLEMMLDGNKKAALFRIGEFYAAGVNVT